MSCNIRKQNTLVNDLFFYRYRFIMAACAFFEICM